MVCNVGLDITVGVGNDDSRDAEEKQIPSEWAQVFSE